MSNRLLPGTRRSPLRQLLTFVLMCATSMLLSPGLAHAVYDWPNVALLPAATGLPSFGTTDIANAGDSSNRLFIVQKTGTIRIIKNGSLLGTPFLDLSSRVSTYFERGLLSIAFPPGYASKGYFYVYYTDLAGNIVVARYFLTANPDVANFDSEQIILTIPHSCCPQHNGGQLAFGPDGYLYLAPGDGGGTPENGQDPNALLGKMLRIDVESSVIPYPTPTPISHLPYVIPLSNPYVSSTDGYRDEIWALGFRNPFRFSFDREIGDLYIADVGQNTYEEVDYQPVSSFGGENYGWNIMEGSHCYPSTASCSSAGLTLPIIEYDHSQGDCSVIGGFVYRGTQFARMAGVYFYSDYCSGKIWGAVNQGGTWLTQLLYDAPFNVTTFGEDEAGNVYVADFTNGIIYTLSDLTDAGPCAPVTWASVVNVTPNGNNLQKTAGGTAWNAGAIASTQITSGNGAAQIRVDNTGGFSMFGLSNSDPDAGYASIKYAWYMVGGGALYIYEGGVNRGQFGTYAANDLLKVEVSGGVVRYYRMAAGSGVWTLKYTSSVAPIYPLLLDTSFATVGASLTDVQFGTGSCALPATATPTRTPTPTVTPTFTPTRTPTLPPTSTPTFTPTSTPLGAAGPCAAATWTSAVNVTPNGNNLQKTAGGTAWNAGAIASTQITSGSGAAQIRVDSTGGFSMFGLSNGNPDAGYASIKYAWYQVGGGALYIYEGGVNRGQFGTYAANDLLKVEVSGGVVRYYWMAAGSGVWTLKYTSSVAPIYPLLLDTSFATVGALLTDVQFGTGSCATATPTLTPTPTPTPIPCAAATWTSAVNVTPNGNNLQKTAGGTAWNAGAIASTQITSGNGAAQIRVDNTGGFSMFGLSNSDPDAGYASIKYAWYMVGGGALYIYEGGVNRGQFGTYAANDLLKVEVSGGVVRYYWMAAGGGVWTLKYTSSVAPIYPLLLDTSFATVGASLADVQFGTGTCPTPP